MPIIKHKEQRIAVLIFDKVLKKFIKLLDKSTGSKLVRTIELLSKFNYKLGLPHSKRIIKNIYELRTHGNQNVRVFYAFHKNQIVLLHGFIKKSPKIPPKEVRIAQQKLNLLTSK